MQKWVRSKDGLIAGICEGLGNALDVSPWAIRCLWLVSIFGFGTGFLLYAMFWYSLPKEGTSVEDARKKILGVCWRLSAKLNIDVGVVRFIALTCLLSSFGVAFFLYIALHITMPKEARA